MAQKGMRFRSGLFTIHLSLIFLLRQSFSLTRMELRHSRLAS